jgi:type II secretory pathway component PulF
MSIVLFFWYPAFCIFPIVGLFLLYIAVFLMIYAAQNKHPEFWRSKVESTLNMIPVMGTARRHLAISRFSAALEALISAGVSIIEAWDMAARASGSIAIQRMVESWIPMLRAGKTPAEMLGTTGKFPSLFTNQYAAGEISGKLDETLERLRDYYQDSGGRRIQLLAQWVPIAIYVMVLIAGGVFVIWFYVTYFNKAFQAIGI